jgi:TRAP-type C4-dicarboxylate transport system substrate-binding protein
MRVTTSRVPALVVAMGLLGMLPAACGPDSAGDKAGGSNAPAELRLAVAYGAKEPDAPAARFFASRVATLSGGSLRVRVVFDAAGQQTSGPEERVARMVRDGDFDLGWIAARAWDRRGVTSLQALQAPFLVTSQALLARIATGPLASRMLAGLDDQGYVGLALVPDRLRHPLGVRHPLASPQDFAGARVRVIPSRASDALMQALGATPVHVSNEDVHTAMLHREIDGSETALGASSGGGRYLTTNVTLFAKALTLFADRSAYERLDDDQRSVIRRAAEQTVARVATHPPPETALVRRFCEAGRVVLATKADTAALQRAAARVYTQLERDVQTKALIAGIRELKAQTPATPAPAVAASCSQRGGPAHGKALRTAALNGTYRWVLTKAGAVAAGASDDDEDIGNVVTMTLRDGRWLLGDTNGGDAGTYQITGDRLVFDWPATGSTPTLKFTRRADGTLDVKPVLPMERGDRFVWASAPWKRVGPPVRTIP